MLNFVAAWYEYSLYKQCPWLYGTIVEICLSLLVHFINGVNTVPIPLFNSAKYKTIFLPDPTTK